MRALVVTPFLVLLNACAHAPAIKLEGTAWRAEDLGGQGVLERAQSTVSFHAPGRVAGSTGCNRYAGAATIQGEAVSFGQLASTRMACEPALMEQEHKFLKALAEIRRYRVDANGLLHLEGANGEPLMRLAPMAPEVLRKPGAAVPARPRTLVHACDGTEFLVRVGESEVALRLPGRTVVLPQVPSASGAKYQEGDVLFWSKGNQARIEADGAVHPACGRQGGALDPAPMK